MGRKGRSPSRANVVFGWVRRQSMKVKIFVGATLGLCALAALKLTIKNHNYFFVASEAIHALGILVLIYKLTTQNTCSGILYIHCSSCALCRIFWAFGVYMESLSVLPQLRLMQKAKMIEPFTAHYIFALGVSRFLACAHWIIQIYETRGRYLYMFGSGYLWFLSAFLAEMVQSFVLADFCYYYIKSFMQGQLMMRMPI
ncbi:hypothetical protein FNV43_RR26397 [Rhamnella rubrinervis]|uniref:ER lumen protein-retaining receptor n=1 Tax=Rhamnella rubrinervis TaxID=2594499 RepID=A0A8K0GRG9_9ROSA|nr:hypothetical protein FNV43_RR26397 [Rhamnella rubrinervis]